MINSGGSAAEDRCPVDLAEAYRELDARRRYRLLFAIELYFRDVE